VEVSAFFKDLTSLFDRERSRAQAVGAAEEEGEAGPTLSAEPDVAHDPRTLGS